MLHAGRLSRNVRLRVPSLLAVLQLLVELLQDYAEPQGTNNGDAEHSRDDAVALAKAVLLENCRGTLSTIYSILVPLPGEA